MPSPSLPRKKHAYADKATQYSPMEPVNYFSGAPRRALPSASSANQPGQVPPSPPGPRAKSLPEDQPTPESAEPTKDLPGKPIPWASGSHDAKGKEPAPGSAVQPISPSKRRNSQGPGSSSAALPPIDQSLPKRSKQESAAPKSLPIRYELVPVEDMVALIAHMLGELIDTNDQFALKAGHLTRFHSRYVPYLSSLPPSPLTSYHPTQGQARAKEWKVFFFFLLSLLTSDGRTAPGISVLDYLNRLAKHATLTPPLLLSMVYYIDRLCALYPEFTINTLTVHRFLITAATVAAKGLSDSFWNNSTYARVGGVRVAELKLLELEFLYRVDWKIVPNPEVLVAYYRGLVERCPGYVLEDDANEGEGEDSSDVLDDEDDSGADQEFESGDEEKLVGKSGGRTIDGVIKGAVHAHSSAPPR